MWYVILALTIAPIAYVIGRVHGESYRDKAREELLERQVQELELLYGEYHALLSELNTNKKGY